MKSIRPKLIIGAFISLIGMSYILYLGFFEVEDSNFKIYSIIIAAIILTELIYKFK